MGLLKVDTINCLVDFLFCNRLRRPLGLVWIFGGVSLRICATVLLNFLSLCVCRALGGTKFPVSTSFLLYGFEHKVFAASGIVKPASAALAFLGRRATRDL